MAPRRYGEKTPAQIMLERALAERERREADAKLKEAILNGDETRARCATLIGFIKEAWHILEPQTELKIGWAVEAIAMHLEAVTDGFINRLLINCPPGLMKSLITSVFWPAWEWGPKGLAHLRYVATSYGKDLTERDGAKFMKLIESPWYQQLWPEVEIGKSTVIDIQNEKMGGRVGVPWSKMMGKRGNRLICDDPHDLENAESDKQREETVRLFKEGASSRLNDPNPKSKDAIVIIMQRLHEKDISGYVLENDPSYVHLCLPQEFEKERKCVTKIRKDGKLRIFFEDPRKKEGELLFPERFSREMVEREKSPKGLGKYAYSGQHQQAPTPRGGALFQREWFKDRIKPLREIPQCIRIVRHWDLADTDEKALKKAGARTAGVKMGITKDQEFVVFHSKAMAASGAKKDRAIKEVAVADGKGVEQSFPQDPAQAGKIVARGYVKLLVGYIVRILIEKGDKVSRATPFSTQCEFGNVWIVEGPWNEEFLDEICAFPTSARKDVVDACSGAFEQLTMKKAKKKPTWVQGMVQVLALQEE